jgi:hypothetical protein
MFVNGLLRTNVRPVLALSQSPDIIPATEHAVNGFPRCRTARRDREVCENPAYLAFKSCFVIVYRGVILSAFCEESLCRSASSADRDRDSAHTLSPQG